MTDGPAWDPDDDRCKFKPKAVGLDGNVGDGGEIFEW